MMEIPGGPVVSHGARPASSFFQVTTNRDVVDFDPDSIGIFEEDRIISRRKTILLGGIGSRNAQRALDVRAL